MKRVILVGCTLLTGVAAWAEKPNILLVLSDDHSADHVGCYGNPDILTPNIDRFAAQGMIATRAYVTSPQSAPSRASIFTGRSPIAVNMSRFYVPLARRYRTFPEYLREKGYYVGVAGRNYHMDCDLNRDNTGNPLEAYYAANGYRTFADRLDLCLAVPVDQENSEAIFAQYEEFLEKRDKSKPFFLQLSYSDPHRPYTAPSVHDPATLTLPPHYPDTELVREDLAAYYDEIHRFDHDFGQVLSRLEEEGLADNTLVVLMGDNGGAQFMGKGTLYEYGVHVPLIIRWPGMIAPGSRTERLISGEDLAPTFLAAAGIEPPKEMTGRDIMEPPGDRRYLFAERGAHGKGFPESTVTFDLIRCIIGERFKLIYNATPTIPYEPVDFSHLPMYGELRAMNEAGTLDPKFRKLYFPEVRPMFELYDLENDPREQRNLADHPDYQAIKEELILELSYWMIREEDFLPLPYVFKR